MKHNAMEFDKAIFLDIDGVLATTKQYLIKKNSKSYLKKYKIYPFDPKCVTIFNEILKETKAKIILSSDWKLYFSLAELNEIFKINKVNQSPVILTADRTILNRFKTENFIPRDEIRAMEINDFLDDFTVHKYIVVDDIDMSKMFGDRFIHCKYANEGIKQTGIKEKIIDKLNY